MSSTASDSVSPFAVWSQEANDKALRREEEYTAGDQLSFVRFTPSNAAEMNTALTVFSWSGSFRRDLLALCQMLNVIPHPKLLPHFTLDYEEDPPNDSTIYSGPPLTSKACSMESRSTMAFDLSEVEAIIVRNWQLDTGNVLAMCLALQKSASNIRSICLFNVSLTAKQRKCICETIAITQVETLLLDWNDSSTTENSEVLRWMPLILADTSPLLTLSLRANNLSDDDAQQIASCLKTNSKLLSLNLFQNQITDLGAAAIAYALPFNHTLQHLSLANNKLTGQSAELFARVLTTYEAPPELLKQLEAAESHIQHELDQAKKSKKKIDRATVVQSLGLPVLETVDGVQVAPGNNTLHIIVLSGNTAITEPNVVAVSRTLESFQDKLREHLKHFKLQRIPHLQNMSPLAFTEFLVL